MAIVKTCPENLQEKCFELLLNSYLTQHLGQRGKPKQTQKDPAEEDGTESDLSTGEQGDLTIADIHTKARKFLKKYELTIGDLNEIFYKQDKEILPLYDDIKSDKISESQIRIALLQALHSAIENGDFVFDGEVTREECQTRKCYDPGNFTAIFKNSLHLFDNFERYNKDSPKIRLSEEGRELLSKIIKSLA